MHVVPKLGFVESGRDQSRICVRHDAESNFVETLPLRVINTNEIYC